MCNMKKLFCCFLVGVGGLVVLLSASHAAEPSRPHVVIFFTDDQGTLDANCFGSSDLYTPSIDRLAHEGVRFTRAYAHAVCCPSRAMLLTGRYPQRCNVNMWTQGNAKGPKGRNLLLSEVTLAEALQAVGYQTALFGKWHLGADKDHGPTRQGFDEFFGLRGGFIDNYNHFYLHENGFHDLYEGAREVFAQGKYFPDLITRRALSFIDENHSSPFFLLLAFNTPHYPEQSDAIFDDRYKDMKMPRQSYAKMISTTDNRIGKVLEKLDERGIADNTIVICMSDNGHSEEDYQIKGRHHPSGFPEGMNYGAHGGGGNTGKWIGCKGTFLEGGVRVPAVMRFPSKLPHGAVRHQTVSAMDWFPTVLELCGVPMQENDLDGHSLVPLMQNATIPSPYEKLHWQWGNRWAVLNGEWKLLGEKNVPTNLFFLAEDQPEQNDYLSTQPGRVEAMLEQHLQWLEDVTNQHDHQ